MSTRFERILFDLDGTIVIHDKVKQGFQIAEILGLPQEYKEGFAKRLSSLFSHPFFAIEGKMTFERYLDILNRTVCPKEIYGITGEDVFEAIETSVKKNSKLAENIIPTLDYLETKGYRLCVFTNGFYNLQMGVLKHFKVLEYFQKLFTWDNFYPKSDKRAILRALETNMPQDSVMIGDSLIDDMITQKQMGMYTIGYNIPKAEEYPKAIDVNISNYNELREIL